MFEFEIAILFKLDGCETACQGQFAGMMPAGVKDVRAMALSSQIVSFRDRHRRQTL